MAVNFREIDGKIYNDPLTKDELKIVHEVERYIDSEIARQYDGTNCVKISNDIMSFDWDPWNDCYRSVAPPRKKKMKEAILAMYKDMWWDIKYEGGEDNGPNRLTKDQWVFNGIKG